MNGIMCGYKGQVFERNGQCDSDEVCTGTTNEIDAVYEPNKAVLCTKGKVKCHSKLSFVKILPHSSN